MVMSQALQPSREAGKPLQIPMVYIQKGKYGEAGGAYGACSYSGCQTQSDKLPTLKSCAMTSSQAESRARSCGGVSTPETPVAGLHGCKRSPPESSCVTLSLFKSLEEVERWFILMSVIVFTPGY